MCTSSKQQLQEAITIPPDKEDEHEVKLRAKMPKSYVHGDRVIRWYRNAKKDGASNEELSRWVDNFTNVKDLLKTYDEYIKQLGTMKMLDKKVKIEFNDRDIEVDPVKDVDKIRRLKGFVTLVKALGNMIHSETSIHATSQKYALDNKDRKLIKLISYTSKVMVWQTQQYTTTNKFIYHLWQNAETLGRGDVYGDPRDQTPYCTHSAQHWKYYSDGDPEYTQYWFLRTLPDAKPSATGDLDNADVVKVFNAMQGKGARLIVAMDDSNGDLLNDEDQPVSGSYSAIFQDVAVDVIQLNKKLPYFIKTSDMIFNALNECVDNNVLDIQMFNVRMKNMKLEERIVDRMKAFFDSEWLQKLNVKKIVVQNIAQYELNSILRAMKLKKLPVIAIKDYYNIAEMFAECNDIEEVMGLECVNAMNASRMFSDCANLKSVHSISLPVAEDCEAMFYRCKNLQYIGTISMPACRYAGSMLYDCNKLVHIESMNIGRVLGKHCPVDIEDVEEGGIESALPSADKHTKELIADIVKLSIENQLNTDVNVMKMNITTYNYQLTHDYGFSDGIVECKTNGGFWGVVSLLRASYKIRLTPSDDISYLKDTTQNAIREYYARKITPLPLQVKCIDLTNDKYILKDKSFPYIDDTYISTTNDVLMSLPSIKITAEQAKYKDTIFDAGPMSKHETKRLRAKYGDHGEKIDWIIVDEMTKESAQIIAELHDFQRLFF